MAAEYSDLENQLQNHENEDSLGAQLERKEAKDILGAQLDNNECMEDMAQSQEEPDGYGDQENLTTSGLSQGASCGDDNREDKHDDNNIGIMETTKDEKLNPESIQKDPEPPTSAPLPDPVEFMLTQYSTSHHSQTVTTQPLGSPYSTDCEIQVDPAKGTDCEIPVDPATSRVYNNNKAQDSQQNGSRCTCNNCVLTVCDCFCDCLASCCLFILSCLGCPNGCGSNCRGCCTVNYDGGYGSTYDGYGGVHGGDYGGDFGGDNNSDRNSFGGGGNCDFGGGGDYDFGGGGDCDFGGGGDCDFGGGDCGGGDW